MLALLLWNLCPVALECSREFPKAEYIVTAAVIPRVKFLPSWKMLPACLGSCFIATFVAYYFGIVLPSGFLSGAIYLPYDLVVPYFYQDQGEFIIYEDLKNVYNSSP